MVQREMEFRTLGVNESGVGLDDHDLSLWYQSRRGRQGGIVPPPPVLVLGSALGSRRRVALSSAQAVSHRSAVSARTQGPVGSDGLLGRLRAILLRCRAASSLGCPLREDQSSDPAASQPV